LISYFYKNNKNKTPTEKLIQLLFEIKNKLFKKIKIRIIYFLL